MRFEVGEMARVAVARKPEYQGIIVQIMAVGPFHEGQVVFLPDGIQVLMAKENDYISDAVRRDGLFIRYACFKEWQLAKLEPPAEPASLTRSKEAIA